MVGVGVSVVVCVMVGVGVSVGVGVGVSVGVSVIVGVGVGVSSNAALVGQRYFRTCQYTLRLPNPGGGLDVTTQRHGCAGEVFGLAT